MTQIGANPFSNAYQNQTSFGGGHAQQASYGSNTQGVDGITQAKGASEAGNNLLAGANLNQFNPNFPRHDRSFVMSA